MKTNKEARAAGFIIDEHAARRPLGYKGPRFQPTETVSIFTQHEEELMSLLEEAREHLLCADGDGKRTAADLIRAINRQLETMRRE